MYDYTRHRDDDATPDRAPHGSSTIPVRAVGARRVGSWLARGGRDLVGCGGRGLLFGACYVAMGHAIVQAHARDWSWLPGFSAAFLFLGPLLAVGLYELSRQRARGESGDLLLALFAWCRNPRGLCLHALSLCLVLTVWLQLSWHLLNRAPNAVAALPSALWWAAWVAFSVAAFVSSVVAVPMLLDRPVGAIRAVRTSLACCTVNPAAMSLWALVVASSIGVSLRLDFWPLLLTGPWIGHATWHVYLDCIGRDENLPLSG